MSDEIYTGQTWKHVKRGHIYRIVSTNAKIQVSFIGDKTMEEILESSQWIAYTDGSGLYFREYKEFLDGRFVRVS